MHETERFQRVAARAGAAFVVLFIVAFAVSLGTLVGAFADPDREFVAHFASDANQIRDVAGSFLLLLAGLAFAWFVDALSRGSGDRRALLLITGCAAAGGMIVAAIAWATVPLSLWFGSLVDDPGLEEGQAVLPQFGWAALGVGSMLPAAVFVVLVARTPGLVPRWLSVLSYPIAVACRRYGAAVHAAHSVPRLGCGGDSNPLAPPSWSWRRARIPLRPEPDRPTRPSSMTGRDAASARRQSHQCVSSSLPSYRFRSERQHRTTASPTIEHAPITGISIAVLEHGASSGGRPRQRRARTMLRSTRSATTATI